MDYINIPRSLIYKDRTDLKDFGVQELETVNHQLFLNLKELFKATDRAKELILRCFNNAYYICTLIPFEDFPDMQVAEYEKLLLKDDPYDREEVCAVSMAMVSKLLQASDARWRVENNDMIKNINYRFTHYMWIHSGARNSFEFMEEKHNTDCLFLSPSEFAPRNIIEAIENVNVDILAIGVKYVCERLALLDDSQKRIYGANLAIARLNDDLRDIYVDWGYDPKTKKFDPEMNGPLGVDSHVYDLFEKITKLKEEAVDYITEHYPMNKKVDSKEQSTDSPHAPETEDLQAQIRELKSKLTHQNKQLMEANNINTQQATRIKELDDQVTELQQKLSESGREQGWIDWLDHDVFDSRVNAEKIYEKLKNTPTTHLTDRPRCYVLFRVLSEIGGLKKNASQKDVLKWWNAHFECGWCNDNQFKFSEIPDSITNERDVNKWNKCGSRKAEHYHAFAQDLIKEFAWIKRIGEYEIKAIYLKK